MLLNSFCRHGSLLILALTLTALLFTPLQAQEQPAQDTVVPMTLVLDATDLPRQLIVARWEMDVTPGNLVLRYPEWVQGTHAPTRQMQNVAGFEISDMKGNHIYWVRHTIDRQYFNIDVPEGVDRIQFTVRYITSQPNVNSRGVDCFGTPNLGIINWNCIVLYPAVPSANVDVTASLILPDHWKQASAMRVAKQDGNRIDYEKVDLDTLVDRPVILGEHLKSVDLKVEDAPPHRLHLLSDIETSLRLDDDLKEKLVKVVTETADYLGGYPYDSYDFLVVVSDNTPRTGLEHTDSSLSVTQEKSLVDEKVRKRDFDYLIPHEFAHAWCGKYRRPAGMIVPDMNTPMQTELLWVYEGLTQFLSWTIPIRAGLQTQEEFLELFAFTIERLRNQQGRHWRPLEDTAAASSFLRGGSRHWGYLRRNQDYYQEGALMWLEADVIIRSATMGQKSLTDFTRSFFARRKDEEPARGPRVVGFNFDQIVDELNGVYEWDWADFLITRTREAQSHLPVEFLTKAGYKLVFSPKPTEFLKDIERTWGRPGWVDLADSIGFSVNDDGDVFGVVPGRPGERSGLYDRSKILAVNGRKFSRNRILDAVEQSVLKHSIELLVQEGELFRNLEIKYSDGLRYLRLERDETHPDWIAQLMKPLGDKDKKPSKSEEDKEAGKEGEKPESK